MEASQLLNVDADFMNRNTIPLIVVLAVGTYGTEMPTMMITPYNDIVVGRRQAFALLKDQQFEFPFRGDRRDARFYDVGAYTRVQQVDRNRDPLGPLRHVQHPIRDAFDKAVENAVTGFLEHGIPPRLASSQIPGPPSKPVAFDVEANGNIWLWLPNGIPTDEFVDVRVGRTSPQCVQVVHDKQIQYPPGTLLVTEGDYGPELLVMRHPEEPTAFLTAAESFGVTHDALPMNATVDPMGQLLLW